MTGISTELRRALEIGLSYTLDAALDEKHDDVRENIMRDIAIIQRALLSPATPEATGDDVALMNYLSIAKYEREKGNVEIANIIERMAAIIATLSPYGAQPLVSREPDPVIKGGVSQSAVERARKLAAEIMVAMRQARFPKEYADEAHDEFESLTLTPMLTAALATQPASDTGLREQGRAEGFAAAVAWLRDRSAMKPPATLWHAASLLADQLEQSRIPRAALNHKAGEQS